MSKFAMFLAFCLLRSFGFAQNGNGNAYGGDTHASSLNISASSGAEEIVELRISGQDANTAPGWVSPWMACAL